MYYHLTAKSSNRKTGPIPVSTTSSDSCPDSCPLKWELDPETLEAVLTAEGKKKEGPCYAPKGKLGMHWRKVDDGTRGIPWGAFLDKIRAIGAGLLRRHNQAGDLPGVDEFLDTVKVQQLTAANGDSDGFTYTHKREALLEQPGALQAVLDANRDGFTINVSCDTLEQVDQFTALGLPAVLVLPEDSGPVTTPGGETVKICPAILEDRRRKLRAAALGLKISELDKIEPRIVNCLRCKLCAKPDRRNPVGFPAHGSKSSLIKLEVS